MRKKINKYVDEGKREQAFSLVELIIVILIISISMVPLSRIIRTSQRGIGDMAIAVQAEFFAQCVMEEIISDYNNRFEGYDYLINNWDGRTENHPNANLNMTAGVGIVEDVDADTGVKFAEVMVSVNVEPSVSLTCLFINSDM